MSRRFAIIPARALDDKRVECADLRILCALGRETDKHGWCKVKQATIARSANLSRSYVNRRISHLVACGLVEKHDQSLAGRGRGASRYRLMFDIDVPPSDAPDDELGDVLDDDPDAVPDLDSGPDPDVPTVNIGPPDVPPQDTPPVSYDSTAKDTFRSSIPEKVDDDSARARFDLAGLKAALSEASGNAVNWQSPRIAVLAEPVRWLTGDNAVDAGLDLIPTVRCICAARDPADPINSWSYFRKPVFQARDRRLSADLQPNPEPKDTRHDPATRRTSATTDSHDNALQIALSRNAADRAEQEDFERRMASG